jgi:hypothetical protein
LPLSLLYHIYFYFFHANTISLPNYPTQIVYLSSPLFLLFLLHLELTINETDQSPPVFA